MALDAKRTSDAITTVVSEYNNGIRQVPQISVKNIGFHGELQQAILAKVRLCIGKKEVRGTLKR